MKFMLKEIQAGARETKLSVKDKKLLQLLIQNGRASVSHLAKNVGISKPAIVQKVQSLREKNVLLEPVFYSDVRLDLNQPFCLYEIQTYLGINNQNLNSEILSIKGVASLLWYNGPFNLLLVSMKEDPQDILEKLEKIIPISKLRYSIAIGNWFHPPYLFQEIKDVNIDFKRTDPSLTHLDEKIILCLEDNPRANLNNIAAYAKSSPITIKKRMKLLEKNGAIVHFSNYVNMWACGYDLVSVSFIVKGKENTNNLISNLLNVPQTGNIWEFTHEWNINTVFWVKDQNEVNQILSKIYKECKGILDTEVLVLAGMVGK